MQYSGKVQQKALTLIQGTLVQSDPAAPGIGANASAGEIATWIEDDGGLKGALRILATASSAADSEGADAYGFFDGSCRNWTR